MKKILVALLLSSFGAASVAADRYTVDANHTHATFTFQHYGLSSFDGKIPAQAGTIVLDREKKTGSIDVTFDLEEISTGVEKFDDHLRGEDFFEVDKHPKATFKASKITFEGEKPASITGDLTIKNITKPVTLKVTSFQCVDKHPMSGVPVCGANATAQIKRSEFGLKHSLPEVHDEIDLRIEVEAMKK